MSLALLAYIDRTPFTDNGEYKTATDGVRFAIANGLAGFPPAYQTGRSSG